MKIAILDGHATNPGDLSWQALAAFGELEIYERTAPALVNERCGGAAIVLTNKAPLDRQTLEKLPFLKMIGILATGYNVIDIAAANEKNITVCNAPAYGTASVAQHTIALLLELTNRVGIHDSSVHAGEWQNSKDWCYSKSSLIELDGKTLGVIGFGNIGQQTARIAKALGMKISYNSLHEKNTDLGKFVSVEKIFSESDIVSLHCPLKNNAGFVDKRLLQLMKPSSYLINTSRGQLINEQDLADALNKGSIAAAALDVLSAEPPGNDNPLLTAKNCIITPHNAWMSREARQRIIEITVNNVSAFLRNEPEHVVR